MARDNIAQYPTSIWDGSSPSRPDATITERRPDAEDHEQVIAEIRATQNTLNDEIATRLVSATNDNAGTMVAGAPVYVKSDGDLDLADASAIATCGSTIGLVAADAATTTEASVVTRDVLTLTTAQWDAVTGDTGGLTPGSRYYVSLTAGELTTTAPSTSTEVVKQVGIALSTTQMLVTPTEPTVVP